MLQKFLFPLASLALASPLAIAQNAPSVAVSSGQSFNPDTSINFLTLYKSQKREGSKKSEPDGGFALQEAELQFMSNVDAYFRAVAMFSVHQAEEEVDPATIGMPPDPEAAGEPKEKKYAIEPEEVYLETTALPYVTFKLGRFHADLGRHNQLHAHAYPFVDGPLISQRLMGEEGLIENGLSASVLVPLPWYMEVSAQALQGDSPTLFSSESSTDVAKVYRMRNLWDLSDSTTLDLGISGAEGHNYWNGSTKISGADISLKWRPTHGGKYQSLALAAEFLQGDVGNRPVDAKLAGYSAWVQYQATQRFWVQVRTEEAKSKDEGAKTHRKLSGLIAFNPTEFSGIRLQVDQLHDDEEKPLNSLMIQGNITIGAHPAHSY